jgi:hypothetical protein
MAFTMYSLPSVIRETLCPVTKQAVAALRSHHLLVDVINAIWLEVDAETGGDVMRYR